MENFYFSLRPEFLDTRLMRAFLSKYLRENGYYCRDVFFVQVRFKPETKPKFFDNSLGYNLVYETIAYRPKQGWSWEKLVKDWYAEIDESPEPEKDLLSIIKHLPYDHSCYAKFSASYQQWSESGVSLDGKLEVIKVYFDILSGQISFRDYAKSGRNDEKKSYKCLDYDEQNNFYRWMSCGNGDKYNHDKNKYGDSWYEECIYEPDCFNLGVVNFYKITHEPYYEKQYQLFDGKNYDGKKVVDWDIQASSLLSPLEIIQYLYWQVYQRNPKEKNYDIDSYLKVNEPSIKFEKERDFSWEALGSKENDKLWIDRFINPNTKKYSNRALFYTTNVLELTTEMKIDFSKEIASLRKDLSEFAEITTMSIKQITGALKDIYLRMYYQQCMQIKNRWADFSFLVRELMPKTSCNELMLWFHVNEVCNGGCWEITSMLSAYDNPLKEGELRELLQQKLYGREYVGNISKQAQVLEGMSKKFEQKYQDYVQSMNKFLQIEQNLQSLKEQNTLPSLEELGKMQELLD